MELVKKRKIRLMANMFAIMGLLTMLANFSVYKLPGIYWICMILLVSSYMICSRTHGVISSRKKEMRIFGMGWALVYLISIIFNFCFPSLSVIFAIIFGMFFLSLNRDIQKNIIYRFVWLLAVILLLSIIEFLLFQLSRKGFVLGQVTRVTDARETYFLHLLFNIISTDAFIPRFQSLAEEPGLIGTLCGFLLFFTWKVKSMRFPFYVFLFSGIISFSLAYYVILLFFLISCFKFNIRNVTIVFLVSFLLYQVFKENIDLLILSRVDVENSVDIDNRTTDVFDYYFEKAYNNGQLWLGVGAGNLPPQITMGESGGNAGAKKWIFQLGIIGFFTIFIVYNIIYRLRKKTAMTSYDWIFLLIFWLSFYQRETILNSYTLLAFLAMPIRNDYQYKTNKIIKNESNNSN